MSHWIARCLDRTGAAVVLGLVTWPGVHFVSGHRGGRSISFQLRALYTLSILWFHPLLTPRGNPTTSGLFALVPVPSLVKGEGSLLLITVTYHHFRPLVSTGPFEVRDTQSCVTGTLSCRF